MLEFLEVLKIDQTEAKYMLLLITDKTATSTKVAELEPAIRTKAFTNNS